MRSRQHVLIALSGLAFAFVAWIVFLPLAIDAWVISKYRPQVQFNAQSWLTPGATFGAPSQRQQMIRDLIENVLPGKDRAEIERLLGSSPKPEDLRRYTLDDLKVRQKDPSGAWIPFPRTGSGYEYDHFEWDLIYGLGKEHIFWSDHKGEEMSPDNETLIIRLDDTGHFKSWYIVGSERWPKIVSRKALTTFRQTRNGNGHQ